LIAVLANQLNLTLGGLFQVIAKNYNISKAPEGKE
jgi:hypothetical protein